MKTLEYSKISETGVPDMVDIDELNSASLLFNLMNRYKKKQIYTYVGPILLALNPFGPVPGITGPEVMARYKEIITTAQPLQLKKTLDPHIYTISAIAYRNLRETRTRQGIVISGESGAGKTESAKIAMDFLTKVMANEEAKQDDDIGTKILACNPILEGFGNAKTVRNNNSSRFGKYTLMYFGLRENKVFGARIKNYLLEKSRVVKVAENERGYHIFYFLVRGASEDMLEKLFLLKKTKPKKEKYNPLEFEYLKTGGDLWLEHDVDGFKEVQETMVALKFSETEMDFVWRSLAVVLHLGQIEYDAASFDDPQNPSKPGQLKNPEKAEQIAKLLGFKKPEELSKILLQNCMKMAKDELWTPNS
jgi:myosin heavy subunit